MQNEDPHSEHNVEQRDASRNADVTREVQAVRQSLATGNRRRGLDSDVAWLHGASGMPFFHTVIEAAADEKTFAIAAIRCACIFGCLFPTIAFFICLIITAATNSAPTPTYILEAAILGIIVGIIVAFALRVVYHKMPLPHWWHG